MTYIVLDLEWNGTYCQKLNGYFNEIIEIGAVKVSPTGEIVDRFDVLVCPVVSRKLTSLVTNLTGFTDDDVRKGIPFTDAMEHLRDFVGNKALVMTWSNTDLMVLMENYRYFYGREEIDFMGAYIDLQLYAQTRLQLGTSQQVALGKFAQMLGVYDESVELHHAIDDSELAAVVFRHVYEEPSFEQAVQIVDEEFYKRLTFKPTFLKDIHHPLIPRGQLHFSCEDCGKNLKRTDEWRFTHRFFSAHFWCAACQTKYLGRVQARQKYDGVEIKKRLIKQLPTPEKTEEIS